MDGRLPLLALLLRLLLALLKLPGMVDLLELPGVVGQLQMSEDPIAFWSFTGGSAMGVLGQAPLSTRLSTSLGRRRPQRLGVLLDRFAEAVPAARLAALLSCAESLAGSLIRSTVASARCWRMLFVIEVGRSW